MQHVLLYGSGTEAIEFSYREAAGRRSRKRHPFEGILPNLTRRYRETESPMVREELARYLGVRPCPECQGTRLNRAARFVFVAGKSLPEVAHLTVGRALEFFSTLKLAGLARRSRRARSSRACVERLRFLVRRGARVPDARSQRRDALGRGIAAHPARKPGRLGTHRRHVHPR